MRLSPARALFVALALLCSARTSAAELTRVASSFELDAPFGAAAALGFAHAAQSAVVTREGYVDGAVREQPQLSFFRSTRVMPLRLVVGVFRDVQLSVGSALVLGDKRTWNYAPGVTDTNSSVTHDCNLNRANDAMVPGCTPDARASGTALFAVPNSSWRAGLDNLAFGLAWAAMNEEKEPGHPTWVLGFEYVAPTAKTDLPGAATTSRSPGGIGDRVHRFNLSTALSRRMGLFDPYFKFTYSIPSAAASAFSNCDDPTTLAFGSENCGQSNWPISETGIRPQHVVSLQFGSEVVPWQDGDQRKVGVDLQFGLGYFSEGRVYNELSDALGKVLYTGDYLSVGGRLGAYVRLASFAQIRFDTSLYVQTDHLLTDEPVGKDLDGACPDSASSTPCVDISNGSHEVNPNFDFRFDLPGRRFRLTRSKVLSFGVSALFTY